MDRCPKCMHRADPAQTVCPLCGYDRENTSERFDQLPEDHVLCGRYSVGVALGRGGFGITYAAWDERLRRRVAIKEYLPHGIARRSNDDITVKNDTQSSDAFLKGIEKTLSESCRLAEFSDFEGVVNVFDCFEENGTAYIVMEFLEGQNVKQYIQENGKLSFEETMRIITPILKTLSTVHKNGLIHRDISPDNIFLCNDGKIKLLDFGSARVADDGNDGSRSIVLKHGYAPKEQYSSRGKQGAYTDMYAVAATLYKMLTGITPQESIERLTGDDELQDVSELVEIPKQAAYAIMQGLEIKEKDRIQTADEFLEKLAGEEKPLFAGDETVTMTSEAVKQKYGDVLERAEQNPEPKKIKAEETKAIPKAVAQLKELDIQKPVAPKKPAEIAPKPVTPAKSEPKVTAPVKSKIEENKNAEQESKEKVQNNFKKIIPIAAAVLVIAVIAVIGVKVKSSKSLAKANSVAQAVTELTISQISTTAIQTTQAPTTEIQTTLSSKFANVKVGDIIKFGKYEQDNNTSNGKEEIEWQVLDKQDGKILIISKYVLDCKPYNTDTEDVTWEACSLRKWLNRTFYNSAFNTEEREAILSTYVDNEYNSQSGNNTTDNVFLLSVTESEKYFSSEEARKCVPTEYAVKQGVHTIEGKVYRWLRTRSSSIGAYYVDYEGFIDSYFCLSDTSFGVRPALWIEI